MTSREHNLTTSQFLIWLGLQQHPDAPIYNMVATFAIQQPIDKQLFERAFRALLAECDALRTVFFEHGGVPQRQVLAELEDDSTPEYIDFSTENAADKAFEVWLEARRRHCFDLSKKAFDCALIKLAETHYVWYFNQHHLITDARSTEIIFERMSALYQHLMQETPDPQLSKPTPAFEDYATYEAACVNSAGDSEAAAHWQTLISEWASLEPAFLYDLRPTYRTTQSTRISIDLGPARSAAVNALMNDKQVRSINRDVTLYQVFLTVLFALLYRISAQKTLFIGAPNSNRAKAAHRNTVGLLMEILTLRVSIDEGESLASLHEKVRAETLDFFRHAQPGLSSLELARTANVLLNFVKVAFPQFADSPVNANFIHSGASEPHHQLRVQVRDFADTGSLSVDFDFNDALDKSLQQAATEAYIRLLDAFIDERSTPLAKLDLLSSDSRQQVLVDLNATATPYQSEAPLHVRFEAQARKHPKRIAVSDADHALSYAELDEHSNRLARELEQRGVLPGQYVALQLERGCEFIVAMLAALKLGAAYLPVDTDLPDARQHLLLRESECAAVVTTAAAAAKLDIPAATAVVCIDSDWPDIIKHAPTALQRQVELDDLAYILFTSGSTGKPKGVLCNHRGVVNLLEDFEQRCALDDGAACSWWTSAGFDVSVYEIFSALAFGGSLHIVPAYLRADTGACYQWLCQQDISSAYLPPFMLETIAGLDAEATPRHRMKRILVGVEPIAMNALASLYRNHPDLTIINGYGPTEATICATLYTVPDEIETTNTSNQRVPIGYPVRNNRVYILDPHRQPLPRGAPGELFIGGHGLARGYLDQPELTAERFVHNPFDEQPDSRLYRSGDRVRILENGALEFLGRVDHQLKIRGYRIEPAEIENTLTRHPDVSEAVVSAYPVANGDPILVAYLLTAAEALSAVEWFEWLSGVLPTYMIPKVYMPLPSFPRTSSGKIDRPALPEPVIDEKRNTLPTELPESAMEIALARIWANVLNIDFVGIHDHFIELGGDSMQALQIAAHARETGIGLTPRQLFETPTVAGLAKIVTARVSGSDSQPHVTGPAAGPIIGADLSEAELDDLLNEYGEDAD